jgi:predicted dehydrogenase
MPTVAIIGAGGIGSRHLQSLSKIKIPLKIFVVDPIFKALKIAKKMLDENTPPVNITINISYVNNIKSIPNKIDIAIIATNADVRKIVFTNLVQQTKVQYVIFEKVAFQSVKEFQEVINILDDLGINSWVNCTRRMFPFYKKLKGIFAVENKVEIHYSGSNWGLGCNAIHFLDLFAYLTGQIQLTIDFSGLNKNIYPAKRNDVVEFGGTLKAKTQRNDILSITDYKNSCKNSNEILTSKNFHYHIIHSEGIVIFKSKDCGWVKSNSNFSMPYQSELTHILVMDILNNGVCDLTPIYESFEIHKSMLGAFNKHLKSVTGKKYLKTPVT